MRFVCESCRAQYMINDEKVGPKGVKVRCRKCGYVILVKRGDAQGKAAAAPAPTAPVPSSAADDPDDALATQVMQNPLTAPPAPSPRSGSFTTSWGTWSARTTWAFSRPPSSTAPPTTGPRCSRWSCPGPG